jgi:hypothetical protein
MILSVHFRDLILTCHDSHHSYPDIPGLRDFKGHITHSADWDHNYDYSNKRIAVIGNGSSGIQIVPQLAALPGSDVTNFMRGPTWIFYRVPPSKHLGRQVSEPNPAYTEEEKKHWREHPEDLREYRRGIIRRTNKAFSMVIKTPNLLDCALTNLLVVPQRLRCRQEPDERSSSTNG